MAATAPPLHAAALGGARSSDAALPAPPTVASRAGRGGPRPFVPLVSPRLMDALHRPLSVRRVWSRVARWLLASPRRYQMFARAEEAVKGRLFGCRMCAQCALPSTAYTCPMTCPKQIRNGPCGGVAPDGGCEVYPEMRCVWLVAYERAEAEGKVGDLRRLQRPIDQRRWGESSWVNYWLGRDDGLWTEDDGLGAPTPIARPAAVTARSACGTVR